MTEHANEPQPNEMKQQVPATANAETTAEASPECVDEATTDERAPWLAPYRWKPGQSGNPSGRPRESGSLAAALRRVGIKPAKTRTELAKIARQLGMDLEEVRNIDVVAGLVYEGITQLLIRTVKGNTKAGDKLVGLLQLLFKALDGDERRITVNGPGELEAALTSVSAVLGFTPGAHAPLPAEEPDDAPEPGETELASPSP
jgi:hypothetical protein